MLTVSLAGMVDCCVGCRTWVGCGSLPVSGPAPAVVGTCAASVMAGTVGGRPMVVDVPANKKTTSKTPITMSTTMTLAAMKKIVRD